LPETNVINYRLLATQVGDNLKYNTTINEINRIGQAVLQIVQEDFPNASITSSRAQTVYNWILSLAKTMMEPEERIKRLVQFCLAITPVSEQSGILKILADNNCPYNIVYKDNLDEFMNRNFHGEVIKNSKKLFLQENYFHAVFEAAKAYNNDVKIKAKNEKNGQPLMMDVWASSNGVLKITPCITQTDKDYQDGIKFISSGIMSAIRNPTAHEPAITWPINKQDCLDILSLISFLYRQLDKAVYYKDPAHA
jgi:uncharacterized protein (TIGR02391 family)